MWYLNLGGRGSVCGIFPWVVGVVCVFCLTLGGWGGLCDISP